jgi:hypothetical protein
LFQVFVEGHKGNVIIPQTHFVKLPPFGDEGRQHGGMVDFNIRDNGRTGLGDTKGGLFFHVFRIRKNGKFRAKTYVKNRRHPPGFQVTV